MRQTVYFALIAIVIALAGYAYNAKNPLPAKNYTLVYFGAGDCGACQQWRQKELPEWQATEAAKNTRLVIRERRFVTQLGKNAFLTYNEAWQKAGGGTKGVPAFVLIDEDTNRITATFHGLGGWNALESRLIRTWKQSNRQTEKAD